MKLKLKVIYSTARMQSSISNDLKEYLKKDNEFYDFVGIKDNPDFVLCHEFKIWKKKCPAILITNKPILTNIIVFDRFKLNDKTALRRLYLGTLSLKNTLDIPFIPGRAEKLINEYNVEFSKKFIYNKEGIIVLCPNRHVEGWYKYNKSTLSSLIEIERNLKIIKENSNLKIEIRIHPATYESSLKHLLETYNVTINKDDFDILSKKAYCIIADRSSIATKMFLKGNIVFNFQEDYEHSIIGRACVKDPTLLNPDNLVVDKILSEEDRYNYLQFIATQTYTDDEINNGYFLETIFPFLLENKDKFSKLKEEFI